ncbi:MAG: hypothetical protein JXR37_26475 [Kiritimatiellae bacterium]|nr:hypothetical protein [Kiritimatiellia bacterium]
MPELEIYEALVREFEPMRRGYVASLVRDRSFPEHFYSNEHPVGPEWREVVLHANDLKPYRREGPTRDLVPGLGITGLDIHGFGADRLFVDRYEIRAVSRQGAR